MSQQIRTTLDFLNSANAGIVNLRNPAAAQDAATKAYVDSAVEGLAWKDSCRVATQGNLNLASPGASIDGVALSVGDRFLARAQTAQSENGIYVWNGAATPATRAPDASSADELEQAVVTVEEGTSAGASFRQQTVNFVLGTGNVVWGSFGTGAPAATETTAGIAEIATQAETDAGTDDQRIVTPLKLATWSGRVRSFKANIGDGSATQFTVTHNLNTRDVQVEVVRVAAPYDTVLTDVERDTVNSVVIRFADAPTANQFRVMIHTVP